jgi:hypothetical protein
VGINYILRINTYSRRLLTRLSKLLRADRLGIRRITDITTYRSQIADVTTVQTIRTGNDLQQASKSMAIQLKTTLQTSLQTTIARQIRPTMTR